MTASHSRIAGAVLASALALPAARAQGTISTQGLGYPPGQFSAAALGTGGATAEMDPASPLNPANLLRWRGTNSLHASYAPEFRRLVIGDDDARTTISRFPTIGAVIGVSSRAVVGLAASTMLDRTFATRSDIEQVIGADTIPAVERLRSEGAMNDVRLAASYAVAGPFRVGLGRHVVTGQNRISLTRIFPDTVAFNSVGRTDQIDYTGQAASLGFEWLVVRNLTLSASGRLGGSLRLKTPGDTTRASGGGPERAGAAGGHNGITGPKLGGRARAGERRGGEEGRSRWAPDD